jgi:cell division septum initiation protein DivIVA
MENIGSKISPKISSKKRIAIVAFAVFLPLLYIFPIIMFLLPSFDRILKNQVQMQDEINELKKKVVSLDVAYETSKSLTREFEKLSAEVNLAQKEAKENTDILGLTSMALGNIASPTSQPNFIAIKSTWQAVDVHLAKNASSKIIGQAKKGITYEYSAKEGNYYYILLSENLKGWIHEQYVIEK